MLLAQKTRNRIQKMSGREGLEFSLRNITVNGQKRGCSGFAHDPATGIYVYLCTEPSVYQGLTYCRYAKSLKDYRGYYNHNCYSEEELLRETVKLLTADPEKSPEYRNFKETA